MCCFKLYHNPTIQRIFWWLSFSFFCGITACGISGIVTVVRFGKILNAVQCSYERVYYDLKFGQLKDSYPRWEGISKNTEKLSKSKELVENLLKQYNIFSDFIPGDESQFPSNYNLKGEYSTEFIKSINEINTELCVKQGSITSVYVNFENNNEIIYNCSKPKDPNTFIGKMVDKINKINHEISDKTKDLQESLTFIKDNGQYYKEDLDKAIKNFEDISINLDDTYNKIILDNITYYINVAKGCGQIWNMVYLIILCCISFFGIILLMGYTYLKNQNNLIIPMHIVWNCIKFFEFSFFMFGAAFGMLSLGLRDAIEYNKYLFGDNLNEDTTTYLMPNTNNSKQFLRTCLSDENTYYASNIDSALSYDLNNFYTGYNNLLKVINKQVDLDEFSRKMNIINEKYIRNLEENPSDFDKQTDDDTSDSTSDLIIEDFSLITIMGNFTRMINNLQNTLKNDLPTQLNLNLNSTEMEIKEGEFIDSFDCGFLKNDISMIYNILYDLSVESRILCVISCCIAFFGEIVVNAYLLTMYHYNNTEFKEGNKPPIAKRNVSKRNIEISSRKEFLDKSKPIDMKKYNQKLDLDFDD